MPRSAPTLAGRLALAVGRVSALWRPQTADHYALVAELFAGTKKPGGLAALFTADRVHALEPTASWGRPTAVRSPTQGIVWSDRRRACPGAHDPTCPETRLRSRP